MITNLLIIILSLLGFCSPLTVKNCLVKDSSFYIPAPSIVGGSSIEVYCSKYDSGNSIDFLDIDFPRRGYEPIEVLIQNNTKNSYYLSSSSLNIESVSAKKISKKLNKSFIPRAIGYRIAELFFWPIIIPDTVDTIITLKNSDNINTEFFAKSIKEEAEVIPPYSSVKRIVFVEEGKTPKDISVSLTDTKTNRETICLPKSF